MFNSKLFLIFNFLAVLALAASVYFQYEEMTGYSLDKTLMERFFPADSGSSDAPADAPETPTKTDEKPADKAEKSEKSE